MKKITEDCECPALVLYGGVCHLLTIWRHGLLENSWSPVGLLGKKFGEICTGSTLENPGAGLRDCAPSPGCPGVLMTLQGRPKLRQGC